MLLVLVSVFQIEGRPSPHLSYDLWHDLWVMIYGSLVNYKLSNLSTVEIFFFSHCLVLPEIGDSWVLSSLIRWMRMTVSWNVEESQYSGDWEIHWDRALCQALGLTFLALRSLLGIQSETPSEELYLSQFGGTYMINWPDLFCKQISLDLVVFGGDEGNFRRKNRAKQTTTTKNSQKKIRHVVTWDRGRRGKDWRKVVKMYKFPVTR